MGPDSQHLSDDELSTFFALLRRFCATELDQWETWRTTTQYGDVFIYIGRYPHIDGASADAYDSIDSR